MAAVENWDDTPVVAEVPEIKLFGKWSADEVQVSDISLTVSMIFLRCARCKIKQMCEVLLYLF